MRPTKPAYSYRLLSCALFPIWILHALWQAISHNQADFFWQRLGFYPDTHYPQTVWLHAASVGEVELIKPLVEILQKDRPVLVTTFTVTGHQHAQRIMPATVSIRALPIDFLPISWRFHRHFSFRLGLIAETELWPETLYQASRKGLPLLQLNARLSDKTLGAANWVKNILKTTLGYFDQYLTRTEQDLNNLLELGAKKQRITVAGNLKYAHPAEDFEYEQLIQRPYFLFASTHHPEEESFVKMIKTLTLNRLIVIAPRHPQRAKQILKTLQPLGLNIKQRSLNQKITDDTQVYLADTLGELKAFMAHADLVIMGGSFNQTGGHNVLEPARLGKAVITGPSDDNIQQDITLLLQHEAIIQVDGYEQLAEQLDRLSKQPESLKRIAENARKLMLTQSHILQNYLTRIQAYL